MRVRRKTNYLFEEEDPEQVRQETDELKAIIDNTYLEGKLEGFREVLNCVVDKYSQNSLIQYILKARDQILREKNENLEKITHIH